jgi:hypothetical protein
LVLTSSLVGYHTAYAIAPPFLFQFGGQGTSDGRFNVPTGVEIDGSGKVYAVDTGGNRFQVFDNAGSFIFNVGSFCVLNSGLGCVDPDGAGPLELGDGQFNGIRDLEIASNGNIYVSDTDNHRIQVFDSQGDFLFKWGSEGNADSQFFRPWGIAFDGAGNVYVSDHIDRIQIFDPAGNFLFKFSSFGSGPGQLVDPTGIEFDSSGNLYVADQGNDRVQIFDSSHNFLEEFGTPTGSGNGQFDIPRGIALDSSNKIYVADGQNNLIQVFGSFQNPPTADDQNVTVNEDGSVTFTLTGTGQGTLTFSIVDSPDNGVLSNFNSATGQVTYSPNTNYNGPDSFTFKINDGNTDSNVATVLITVNPINDAPDVGAITASLDPIQVGTTISASAAFTDADTTDTHTAMFDWGDGTTSSGTVTETNGSGTVDGSHAYTQPGVYVITLTVTDNAGTSDQSVFEFIVAYDPEGGFVTGGGFINSPAGAYAENPSLTGKANFGFVSKYQHGANVPTGNTEFSFKVANLNFHSDEYEWLVVAGAKAQFKGTGTINNQGNYGFMLTAIDGQIDGGGEIDKFRIKIWDKDNGDAIVYDNNMGNSDNSNPATAIQGGQITIHKN